MWIKINEIEFLEISFGSDQVLVLGPSLYSRNKESFKENICFMVYYKTDMWLSNFCLKFANWY